MAIIGYQIVEIAKLLRENNIKYTCDVYEKCKHYIEHDYGKKLQNISEQTLRKQLTKFLQTQTFEKRDTTV